MKTSFRFCLQPTCRYILPSEFVVDIDGIAFALDLTQKLASWMAARSISTVQIFMLNLMPSNNLLQADKGKLSCGKPTLRRTQEVAVPCCLSIVNMSWKAADER
jgi:hypothetical protein